MATSSIRRCGSHPLLNLSDASIQADPDHGHPAILLPNQSDDVPHLAVDIGGSLIKLVYFSRNQEMTFDDRKKDMKQKSNVSSAPTRNHPVSGGRLHFVKFETDKLKDCLEFITTNQLHCKGSGTSSLCHLSRESSRHANVIKATGGGAHKFADTIRERLGISLDKRDEMDCLVAGANFLLKISYLNALLYGIKRIFFGGFFIRGHAYTMDVISAAVHYWSKGQMEAMFLRHDGFLGALGAFISYERHDPLIN